MSGPAEGEGLGGIQPPPPHVFGNFKELLRKRCFQPPHFESLFSPPTFKVAPRALYVNVIGLVSVPLYCESFVVFSWQKEVTFYFLPSGLQYFTGRIRMPVFVSLLCLILRLPSHAGRTHTPEENCLSEPYFCVVHKNNWVQITSRQIYHLKNVDTPKTFIK